MFGNKGKATQWPITLDAMKAADQLSRDLAKEFSFSYEPGLLVPRIQGSFEIKTALECWGLPEDGDRCLP